MGTASGIWSHAAAGPRSGVTTMDNSTSGSDGSSSSDSDTISANDFLTLLVTEMQNQDPTADTDPNEYINQAGQCEQPGTADRHQPEPVDGAGNLRQHIGK